jgi:transcriptional regulator with GAF, ATPase, and Fis domain
MVATNSSEAFAAASAAMVRGVDAASTVHVLLADCIALLRADAAGILVRTGDEDLELLAATSHGSAELELHQAQVEDGPCIEAMKAGSVVSAAGDEVLKRWPGFGHVMAAAGFRAVHAIPMRWHTQVLGGLNLFWNEPTRLDDSQSSIARAFADISSLALMQSPGVEDWGQLDERLRDVLERRVVIERAKGVLSYREQLDMAGAFQRLVQLSAEEQRPLTEIATRIVNDTFTR